MAAIVDSTLLISESFSSSFRSFMALRNLQSEYIEPQILHISGIIPPL
jgi:hypothetical protein